MGMFKTQDFYLTCYLGMNNIQPVDIGHVDGRGLFIFEDTPKFQEFKNKYYSNNALVNPLEYKQRIRNLKALTAAN